MSRAALRLHWLMGGSLQHSAVMDRWVFAVVAECLAWSSEWLARAINALVAEVALGWRGVSRTALRLGGSMGASFTHSVASHATVLIPACGIVLYVACTSDGSVGCGGSDRLRSRHMSGRTRLFWLSREGGA